MVLRPSRCTQSCSKTKWRTRLTRNVCESAAWASQQHYVTQSTPTAHISICSRHVASALSYRSEPGRRNNRKLWNASVSGIELDVRTSGVARGGQPGRQPGGGSKLGVSSEHRASRDFGGNDFRLRFCQLTDIVCVTNLCIGAAKLQCSPHRSLTRSTVDCRAWPLPAACSVSEVMNRGTTIYGRRWVSLCTIQS